MSAGIQRRFTSKEKAGTMAALADVGIKVGDCVVVPKLTARGCWWVYVHEISPDGKFYNIHSEAMGEKYRQGQAFGKPRWISAKDCRTPAEHRRIQREEKKRFRTEF